MRTNLWMTTLTLALCLVAAPAMGAAPSASDSGSRLEITNGHILVALDAHKPILHIFPGGDRPLANATSAFTYRFEGLVEYRDLAADGLPTEASTIARLDLDQAAWNVTLGEADGVASVNLTVRAPVKLTSGGPAQAPPVLDNLTVPDRAADVSLVFTVHDVDAKLALGNVDLNVPSTSVDVALQVRSWPFVDAASDRLALDSRVSGLVDRAVGAGVDSAGVRSNGTLVGALSWATLANATGAGGAPTTVPVKTSMQASANDTRIVHTFDAAGLATVSHHGTFGLAGAGTVSEAMSGAPGGVPGRSVPLPGLLVALGAAAVAAVMLRRFR